MHRKDIGLTQVFFVVEDRKLFIGMISKKLSENDIRNLFATFGTVEDCMILRDTAGVSRGKNIYSASSHNHLG